MGHVASMLVSGGKVSVGLAERMLAGIPANLFARKPSFELKSGPKVIDTNHPAFVYGHLSTYPAKLLLVLGLDPAPGANPPGFEDLFNPGKECLDDPTGTIYPPMDRITGHFFAAHRAAMAGLDTIDDARLHGPNPREGRIRDMFPTLGGLAMFYLTSHIMNHLGQVSAWRRCVGLGPVQM
jgi:hypothetical protein